jgi:tagatose 1,6-diphosphate aldolase
MVVPFIYLSQGVSNEAFQYALELAAEAGVKLSGVLCGRAAWQDGALVFVENGEKALEDWLLQDGVRNIQNVNRLLGAAHSCLSAQVRTDVPGDFTNRTMVAS